MIVEVVGGADERPEVRVVDVDDLTGVQLALGAVTDEEADQALRDAGLGRLEDAQTGVLEVEALRMAAEPQVSGGDWAQRWDGVVTEAADAGRLVDDGAGLQVRVESAAHAGTRERWVTGSWWRATGTTTTRTPESFGLFR